MPYYCNRFPGSATCNPAGVLALPAFAVTWFSSCLAPACAPLPRLNTLVDALPFIYLQDYYYSVLEDPTDRRGITDVQSPAWLTFLVPCGTPVLIFSAAPTGCACSLLLVRHDGRLNYQGSDSHGRLIFGPPLGGGSGLPLTTTACAGRQPAAIRPYKGFAFRYCRDCRRPSTAAASSRGFRTVLAQLTLTLFPDVGCNA
jgi:hypothetical protein